MRKQLLGVLLALVIMSLVTAAETQTTGTNATAQAAQHAVLKRLNVVRGNDGISVEMTAVGQLQPKLSTMDHPDRLVIDLPNTIAVTEQRRLAVDSDGVKAVRVGMDGYFPTRKLDARKHGIVDTVLAHAKRAGLFEAAIAKLKTRERD